MIIKDNIVTLNVHWPDEVNDSKIVKTLQDLFGTNSDRYKITWQGELPEACVKFEFKQEQDITLLMLSLRE